MFQSRDSRLGSFGAITCATATLAVWGLGVGQADSQEQVAPGIPLYLEVFINGAPTNLITRFTALNDGALSADADELRNTGISPGADSVRGEVRLNDLPGLIWEINAGDQEIHFDVDDSDRAARVISAAGKEDGRETMPKVEAGYGVVLNYDVSFAAEGAVGAQLDPLAAGRFDARLFSPFGSLSHGFTLSDAGYGTATYRRLDTNWSSALPGRAIEIQIGDIITTGPSWARPVRMGGVSVRRNFGLRPDLVTIPLPEFEGSAALPSTVEIYAGAVRRYAVDVPAGPFALTDLPFPVGTTDAQVVLRDVTGRETRIDLPFLVSADLLRPGMADYALSYGQPRLGTGTQNDRYTGDGFLSGSIRYGVTPGLTLSGHFELGEDLRLSGLGTTFRLGDRTTISTSYAHSRSGVDQGHLVEASAELNFGNLRIQGRTLRSWGVFNDIAMVSAEPDLTDTVFSQITELDQLSINMAVPWHDAGQLSVFASQTKDQSFGNERTLGVSYAQPFLQNGTLFLSALALRGQTTDNVVQAGISFPLGAKSRTTVTADTRRAGGRLTASASGEAGADGAGWRWRTVGVLGKDTTAQVAVSRELALGQVEIVARRSPASQGIGLRMEGAATAAGGGLFFSRRINDAFAVIDVGVPGVEVESENRPVGTTGRGGRLLVPGLRAYDRNTLSIDPMSLPLDADIQSTTRDVRPAFRSGVRVDFGVEAMAETALVELIAADGAPIPSGLSVFVNDTDDELLTGYDGLVYAKHLRYDNKILVNLPDGSTCEARFTYRNTPGALDRIDGVPCR